jgi:hypothetical protein
MFRSLQLLLPALLPSWRFFDYIAPSPRIQYALLSAQLQPISDWLEFRPRPKHVSFRQMLQRLLWNAEWNESLFMTSCAERLMERYTTHSEDQILSALITAWTRHELVGDTQAQHIQFRLLLIERIGTQLQQSVCFSSRVVTLSKPPQQ